MCSLIGGNVGTPVIVGWVEVNAVNASSDEPGPKVDAATLRTFADTDVRVRLVDGLTFEGRLRTDLLSERSLSVYIAGHGDAGATLYLDRIASVEPLERLASVPVADDR